MPDGKTVLIPPPDRASAQLERIIERFVRVTVHLGGLATERGDTVLAAGKRGREATKARTRARHVEAVPAACVLRTRIDVSVGGAA